MYLLNYIYQFSQEIDNGKNIWLINYIKINYIHTFKGFSEKDLSF